ncbi:MAG: ABC-2 family transporter protein [Candidatus Kerfeldbacteria bacterium]|nr:ABC-2 family transporter protein [Candidatus Kerfeldbacteria bacterium]
MRFHRIAKLTSLFFRLSFMQQLAYRKSFWLAIISKVLRMAIVLIFFEAVFLHVDRLGSWDRPAVLTLIATYLTFESLIIITFHRNLAYYLPDHLRKGTFDGFVTKPVPVLPHVGFRIIDTMDLISSTPILALWVYLISQGIVRPSLTDVAVFAYAVVLGLAFTFSLSTIVASISFHSLVSTGLGRIYEYLFLTGRYPTDSLGTQQSQLLTYVIPFAVVGSVPAQALNGLLTPNVLLGVTVPVVVFAWLAKVAWQRGLKAYSSASS